MAGRGLHGWILGVGLMGAAAATGGCGGDDAVQIPITAQPTAAPTDGTGPGAASEPPATMTAAPQSNSAPRLLAPLSRSTSGSRQPILRYTPSQRATVEVCADKGCAAVLTSFEGTGGRAQPAAPLPAGAMFWRVVANRGASATWELVIPMRDTGSSVAWGTVPDYNGDGRADIAIGAPAADGGSVSIFYGAWFAPDFSPNVVLSGEVEFGRALAAVGDVNGDGFVDLGVASGGAPGTVTIYAGGASGFAPGPTLYTGTVTEFGATLAGAGDVNGDGYGDVVVGGNEAAQVYLGGAEGLSTTPSLSLAGTTASGFPDGPGVVQGPADVNADGAPDIYVGGALYLGNGRGGFVAQADFVTDPFGSFAGDENGDGFVDFAAYDVAPGSPAGITALEFLFGQAGEFLFATAGDSDDDGYSDVLSWVSPLVGVPEPFRLYFGAPGSCGNTGCRRFAPITIPGYDPSSPSGLSLAGAGDVNGDGSSDIIATLARTGDAYLFLSEASSPRERGFVSIRGRQLTDRGLSDWAETAWV